MKINISAHLKVFIVLLLCTVSVKTLPAQNKKGKAVLKEYSLTVKDEAGRMLDGVQLIVGEGIFHARSDQSGMINFSAYSDDFITIHKYGFGKEVYAVDHLPEDGVVILTEAKLFKSDDDNVPLPLTTFKKRDLTSSDFVLRGDQLEKYPSSDLRNALTGLVPGLDIIENNGAPGVSVVASSRVSTSLRNYSPLYIVDGMEVNILEMPLDPQEIETVTVVKDIVTKAMYGPKAANGIIYIETKRGKQNERFLDVEVESGVNVVDRFPEWVSGADYARLNNQARRNSNMEPLYSEADIDAYAKNDPYDLYHPSINFKEMLWKDTRPFTRANVSAGGGNDRVRYFAYLGYNGEGDNFKVGSKSDYNRINARSNIDIKITDHMKVGLGIYGGVTINRAPNYSNTAKAIEMDGLLNDITTTPPIAYPVYAYYDEKNDNPWYGVSTNYERNHIGDLESCGYYNELTRTSAANINLDYDFSQFVPGLKSRTFLSFNLLNLTRIGKVNEYIAYTATPSLTSEGNDTILLAKVHDGVDNTDQERILSYYYQRLSFYESLSYDKSFGDHDLQLGLTYFLFNGMKDAVREPDRQQNGIFTAGYTFRDKYSVQGVLNYAGTSSFDKNKRYKVFPSLGIGWVISDEYFMQDIGFLDFLKIRASAGILGYDGLSTAFYYQDRWSTATGAAFGPHSANQWFGSDTEATVRRAYPNRIANYGLSWEKRKEFTAGLEALLFDRKLYVEFNYYNNTRDGIIAKMENMVPYVMGISTASPWYNYDKYRYHGVEFNLSYSGSAGDFKYRIGGNANIRNSKVLKIDEPNYGESYRSKVGEPVDAIFGYTWLGRYSSDAEAQAVIQTFDETLRTGDLKYQDKNTDNVIDENDQSVIGRSDPRLIYGLDIQLSYKNFELFALGSGRAFYDIEKTNRYFQSGTGDNTYSKYVMDNIDGDYPRLTYQKVNNNFLKSDFWLTSGNFFKLQNVEFAYNLFLKNNRVLGIQRVRFYLRGANLFTISGLKDVDPESISSGINAYPLFRTFTGGIKVTF
ncbi:MAG: SusC/RagA family TonB-linked outer membrane protein [Bacteroidales bacterium]|jgi:TonB-linked SusC/RagA family outer membrane protein|nr:SusC/RagA family TonB-linked outer membrane protein [Bacteroidales bacterium]